MNEKHECCIEPSCDVGLKNRYFLGKRITPESFSVEQSYSVRRRQLINRSTFGWGVVNGFAFTLEDDEGEVKELVVTSGLAFDQCGRELVQVDDLSVDLESVIVLDGESGRPLDDDPSMLSIIRDAAYELEDGESCCWLLCVHYAEKKLNPVPVSDPYQCERTEWDNACETRGPDVYGRPARGRWVRARLSRSRQRKALPSAS